MKNTLSTTSRLLHPHEVKGRLNITDRSLRTLVLNGTLHPVRVNRRVLRYSEDEVDAIRATQGGAQ
ncbi:MAG: helix-turn-helix transcriptional regulator [Verrucomicrobiia bacterium]